MLKKYLIWVRNLKKALIEKLKNDNTRAFAKTCTWRITASIDTLLISYIVTGSLAMAGSIMGIEVFTKMGLYYLHERGWSKFRGVRP